MIKLISVDIFHPNKKINTLLPHSLLLSSTCTLVKDSTPKKSCVITSMFSMLITFFIPRIGLCGNKHLNYGYKIKKMAYKFNIIILPYYI